MKKAQFKYLTLSDIHLGHNKNKTINIVDNLRYYFKVNHKLFKTLDAIFLAGDIYDTLLANNSIEFILVQEWLTELVLYCKAHNIKLRILEGTPSHDWKQSKVINTVISKLNIEIDFKYVDTLYIEHMLDYDISILYVPDEYKHSASETYQDVLKLLKENNLTQVDIAIMHGQFNYQLPMIKLESSHDENLYLDIVKYYISIGHIHTASVFDRILAQGSFDRLAQNEEEDKGGMFISINKHGDNFYNFIVNTRAKIFKTFKLLDLTLEEIISTLDKEILKLPLESYIRCIVSKVENINKNSKSLKERYLGYHLKIETEKDKIITVGDDIVHNDIAIESYNITPDNVSELLLKELDKHILTKNELDIANSEIILAIDALR